MIRILAVSAAVLGGAYGAVVWVQGTALFSIRRMVVLGNVRLSTGEVTSVLDGLRGESLVSTDLEPWRRRLLTSPWVQDAALRRVLPSTVEVIVSERRPLVIGRIGTDLYLIDENGVVMDEYGPSYAEFDLPIVDGLARSTGEGGPTVDPARVGLASRLLSSVRTRPELARRISQIDVTDAHDAVVIMEGDRAMVRLGEEQFLERLRSYIELAPALQERVTAIDYVDVRFDERVYVRPAAPRGGARGEQTRKAPRRNQ